MRLMLRFEKGEPVRFISHLDLMRSMQRALVRSGLPLMWSQGFHPHPVFSFAMALPVGAVSGGEYMEVSLEETDPLEAARALHAVLAPGLRITAAGVLPEGTPALMAAVAAADWLLTPPAGADPEAGAALLARKEIIVHRHGKNGPRETDIRPGILALTATQDGLLARLAAGSRSNVSPSLLPPVLWPEADALAVPIKRLETYYEDKGALRPLLSLAVEAHTL